MTRTTTAVAAVVLALTGCTYVNGDGMVCETGRNGFESCQRFVPPMEP
jgi:hypothetical protein